MACCIYQDSRCLLRMHQIHNKTHSPCILTYLYLYWWYDYLLQQESHKYLKWSLFFFFFFFYPLNQNTARGIETTPRMAPCPSPPSQSHYPHPVQAFLIFLPKQCKSPPVNLLVYSFCAPDASWHQNNFKTNLIMSFTSPKTFNGSS